MSHARTLHLCHMVSRDVGRYGVIKKGDGSCIVQRKMGLVLTPSLRVYSTYVDEITLVRLSNT